MMIVIKIVAMIPYRWLMNKRLFKLMLVPIIICTSLGCDSESDWGMVAAYAKVDEDIISLGNRLVLIWHHTIFEGHNT